MKRRPLIEVAQDQVDSLSRKELYAAIMCGEVFVDGERIRDPRRTVGESAEITLKRSAFVSRGGEKLDHALSRWGISVADKVFVDAGSSTGGFTDCLLQRGAAHVHAVDVGTNQLAYRLRTDPRVSVRERTNLMELLSLNPPADAAVADLSFRSLRGAASHLLSLTTEGWAIVLVKPQFEIDGRDEDFHGVVRDDSTLKVLLTELVRELWGEGVYATAILESPIRGRKGNREFLARIQSADTGDQAGLIGVIEGLFP